MTLKPSASTVRTNLWRHLRSPAALALYATLLAVGFGWLQPLELHLLDLRAALSKHTVDSDVVLIEIDAHSLQTLKSWPWPRRYHAQLLDVLRDTDVKDVFYDVDFSSASTPQDDNQLAAALKKYPPAKIMLPAFIQPSNSHDKHRLVESMPLPDLRRNSSLVSVNLHPDNDGLVRRITASWHLGAESVSLAAIRMAGLDDYRLDSVPLDFGIRPDSIARLSFVDVLAGAAAQ